MKYSKEGDASFLSHREAMHALERALRRSGLPLSFTEGYSPRPRMSFSPALPLGVAAKAEYLEVVLLEDVDSMVVKERLNQALPEGLKVREVQPLAPTMPKLSRWARYGLFRVGEEAEATYLLLMLNGEEQGRLKDALEALASLRGITAGYREVTRIGLYASPDEVFEDIEEPLLYYRGRTGVMEEMKSQA